MAGKTVLRKSDLPVKAVSSTPLLVIFSNTAKSAMLYLVILVRLAMTRSTLSLAVAGTVMRLSLQTRM